jgi:NAD(P)-dependent dehydrogenase (short-subunit alcohol dehydrogenase family)
MDLDLAGRAYYVTGISRGVGRAVATALLSEGAFVAGCARDGAALERISGDLPADARGRLLTALADVTDAARLDQAVNRAAARFGRLDGVVANAGAGTTGGVLATPPATWDSQFAVKIHSVLNLVRPALSALRQSDAGRVVIINGVTAHAPEAGMAAVSASRAAVASLARSLAVELGPEQILVNTISLGAIVTSRQRDRHQASGSGQPFQEWCDAEARRRGVLVGRLGTPAEVAPAVLLLLSPLSSYITGSSIDVSGGAGART